MKTQAASRPHQGPNWRRFRYAGFTLVEMLVVIAIVGLLASVLLPAFNQVRQSAHRVQCSSNLRQIAMAMQMYHGVHDCLPQASFYGTSFYSPFTAVLPFLEEGLVAEMYNSDRRYDDAENREVINQQIAIYRCPAMHLPRHVPDTNPACDEDGAPGSYAVNVGTNNPWIGPHNGSFQFASFGPLTLRDIRDGTTHTILIGELDYGLNNYQWGACNPGVVKYGASRWGVGYPGVSIATTTGVFNADGLISGFAEYATFRSDHHGGANFVFADGSVRFLDESIDATLLDALATRDAGETQANGL